MDYNVIQVVQLVHKYQPTVLVVLKIA